MRNIDWRKIGWKSGNEDKTLWQRFLWFAAIWAASIILLGLATYPLRILMQL